MHTHMCIYIYIYTHTYILLNTNKPRLPNIAGAPIAGLSLDRMGSVYGRLSQLQFAEIHFAEIHTLRGAISPLFTTFRDADLECLK